MRWGPGLRKRQPPDNCTARSRGKQGEQPWRQAC